MTAGRGTPAVIFCISAKLSVFLADSSILSTNLVRARYLPHRYGAGPERETEDPVFAAISQQKLKKTTRNQTVSGLCPKAGRHVDHRASEPRSMTPHGDSLRAFRTT